MAIIQKQPFVGDNLAATFLVAVTSLRVNGRRVFTGREIAAVLLLRN